jgi:hypothetical protein
MRLWQLPFYLNHKVGIGHSYCMPPDENVDVNMHHSNLSIESTNVHNHVFLRRVGAAVSASRALDW